MARSNKDDWLKGPGDLKTAVLDDVPVKGKSVLVTGLAAAFSNRASSEALEMRSEGRDNIARVNTALLEQIQFAEGVVEPKFTQEEAKTISEMYGPAFRKVIEKIDALSGVDKEALAREEARFPRVGAGEDGADMGAKAPAGGS